MGLQFQTPAGLLLVPCPHVTPWLGAVGAPGAGWGLQQSALPFAGGQTRHAAATPLMQFRLCSLSTLRSSPCKPCHPTTAQGCRYINLLPDLTVLWRTLHASHDACTVTCASKRRLALVQMWQVFCRSQRLRPTYKPLDPKDAVTVPIHVDESALTVSVAGGVGQRVVMDWLAEYRCIPLLCAFSLAHLVSLSLGTMYGLCVPCIQRLRGVTALQDAKEPHRLCPPGHLTICRSGAR